MQISVRWPPKKTSPRAPFTIAWYAMKRSCGSDGKRGTMSGFSFDGATPLHAICSVIHTGLPPLASFIFAAMSPTTLMSVFAGVGVPAGRIRDRERCRRP